MADNATAISLIEQGLAILKGSPDGQTQPAGGDPWAPFATPQLVTVKGVHIIALAPIAPDWRPSMAMWALGHQENTACTEQDSRPDKSLPVRSPRGYVLWYVNGEPMILFGEMTYKTDAEIDAFLQREAANQAVTGQSSWEDVYNRMQRGG